MLGNMQSYYLFYNLSQDIVIVPGMIKTFRFEK